MTDRDHQDRQEFIDAWHKYANERGLEELSRSQAMLHFENGWNAALRIAEERRKKEKIVGKSE